MVDEQRISDAYEAIAGLAPSPERVRAGIAARARVHRQRRLLLAGAGVVTAGVAVGVPLAAGGRRGAQMPVATLPPPVPQDAPLQYTPSWFPPGISEQFRSVRFDTAQGPLLGPQPRAFQGSTRYWLPDGVHYTAAGAEPPGVMLAVNEVPPEGGGETVDIGGLPGNLLVADTASVEWRSGEFGANLLLTVSGLPDPVNLALRMARSVVYTSALMSVTMRSPWVPSRLAGYTVAAVHPAANGWRQSLTHCSATGGEVVQIVAESGSVADEFTIHLAQPGTLTTAESRRMLTGLVCTAPDLSWVGDR
ncbi:hypothetical protein AB0F81_49815 [Actinoplanes sp. NPDC024001]|uniref:hypothetical protein n=1 Tax=Actinoplanes sp. NPDC024001 TaxID=3154598 RepID=UPI0033D0C749